MNEIELKILPGHFQEVTRGEKKFEVRKNDRNFQVGDIVKLREFDYTKYIRREVLVKITYVFQGGVFGLEKGFCVFSFERISKEDAFENAGNS